MLDLIKKNRSYRRFYQDEAIKQETLKDLVNLARLSASAANKQPLKYVLSCTPAKNQAIFDTLAWAAYLKNWDGPQEGERPAGYIIILNDTGLASPFVHIDIGIASQSILLGAVKTGLGGCILAAIKRDRLRKNLDIPEQYEIMAVLALGKPKEISVIEPMSGGDVKYWRDEAGGHHVPKRSLDEIILNI